MTTAVQQLTVIARSARQSVERFAAHEGYLTGDRSLRGYCAVASYLLYQRARHLRPQFCVGVFRQWNRVLERWSDRSGHAWIELDQRIIDITATQFFGTVGPIERDFSRPVYVCSARNPHYKLILRGRQAVENANGWYRVRLESSLRLIDRLGDANASLTI